MDNQINQPMGLPHAEPSEIHAFRKEIDGVIQKAQSLQKSMAGTPGAREIALVVTKLQEGKMWAGKILESLGSELPAEYADKA